MREGGREWEKVGLTAWYQDSLNQLHHKLCNSQVCMRHYHGGSSPLLISYIYLLYV